MNIVYSMTRNVYDKILPSLRSLAHFNPNAAVYILCEDNSPPFNTPIEVKCIDVSNQTYFPSIGENRTKPFGGYINHLKVYYPEFLPNLDKVIHLDVDTIINDKLDDLWNTDVEGKWFAAVPEEAQTWYRPYGDTYYNMGVALLNLEQMRKDHIGQHMAAYLINEEPMFADQNAWNKFGYDMNRATKLDLRFNESLVTGTTRNPAIIHFCSIPNWWIKKDMYRVEYLNKWKGVPDA